MIYRKRELVSVFIEMMQKDFKNVLTGWMYRHPHIQNSEFHDEYWKSPSEKLIDENKEVIALSDYHIDLPTCDLNKIFFDILDIIHSANLLPNITSPSIS